jgi:hypothetical protein
MDPTLHLALFLARDAVQNPLFSVLPGQTQVVADAPRSQREVSAAIEKKTARLETTSLPEEDEESWPPDDSVIRSYELFP